MFMSMGKAAARPAASVTLAAGLPSTTVLAAVIIASSCRSLSIRLKSISLVPNQPLKPCPAASGPVELRYSFLSSRSQYVRMLSALQELSPVMASMNVQSSSCG